MSLSFTSIEDQIGPAVYILGSHDARTEQKLMNLANEVDKRTQQKVQIVYLDPRRGDGLKVKEFYAVRNLPCVMIIMDDDTVPYKWTHAIPKAEEITYALSQIGGYMRRS